jgi:hypothetical protein
MRRVVGALVLGLAHCAHPDATPSALPLESATLLVPPETARPANSSAVADAVASTPDPGAEADAVLPIPDRPQDANAPESGWCGETAIQEGLLYYGASVSQAAINAAGKPRHPDLYSYEIPVALGALGARFVWFQPKQDGGFAELTAFVKDAVDAGKPVLAGVKILPTKHPEWGLDHFVLVVGYGPKGLLVNTTWGRREWVRDTTTPGLSFKSVSYAIRLDGVNAPP